MHVHVYAYVCMCVCASVCAYVCMYVGFIDACKYLRIVFKNEDA